MAGMSPDGDSLGYRKEVGRRIRDIRRQRKLSLQDVEATSSQEFKASVLGAYERGERSISVPRLQRLATFYAVPVDQLLPRDVAGAAATAESLASAGAMAGVTELRGSRDETKVTIELT